MMPDRVTSDTIFHVRSPCGGTLDWTPHESVARKTLGEELPSTQLWKVTRSAGTTERIA